MKTMFLGLLACVLTIVPALGTGISHNNTPIVIELFTSEGCSSCPPADLWLQRVDNTQPIPGGDLIVLSEHVTYWDHDGWKDPYSQDIYTARQNAYVEAMGLSTPYTPQVIVNGKRELHLNDPKDMREVLLAAASASQVPINISALRVREGSPSVLRAHVEVDGESLSKNADIFAVVALDHAKTQVARGENQGKLLTHVAVAQELVKVGKLEKKKRFDQDIEVKLQPNTNLQDLRLIVLLQEPGPGKVVGAALERTVVEQKE